MFILPIDHYNYSRLPRQLTLEAKMRRLMPLSNEMGPLQSSDPDRNLERNNVFPFSLAKNEDNAACYT